MGATRALPGFPSPSCRRRVSDTTWGGVRGGGNPQGERSAIPPSLALPHKGEGSACCLTRHHTNRCSAWPGYRLERRRARAAAGRWRRDGQPQAGRGARRALPWPVRDRAGGEGSASPLQSGAAVEPAGGRGAGGRHRACGRPAGLPRRALCCLPALRFPLCARRGRRWCWRAVGGTATTGSCWRRVPEPSGCRCRGICSPASSPSAISTTWTCCGALSLDRVPS